MHKGLTGRRWCWPNILRRRVSLEAAIAVDVAQAPDSQPKAKVFISYSREDMVFADRHETALKARSFDPLTDRIEIYAFED